MPEGFPTSSSPDRADAAAGLVVRSLARVVDALILAVAVAFGVQSFVPGPLVGPTPQLVVRLTGEFRLTTFIVNVVVSVVALAYFGYLESSRGRTLGKTLFSLRVIDRDGGLPTLKTAIGRNAWVLLPILPWVGSLAMLFVALMIAGTIATSRTNTGWHDELAGTAVVRT